MHLHIQQRGVAPAVRPAGTPPQVAVVEHLHSYTHATHTHRGEEGVHQQVAEAYGEQHIVGVQEDTQEHDDGNPDEQRQHGAHKGGERRVPDYRLVRAKQAEADEIAQQVHKQSAGQRAEVAHTHGQAVVHCIRHHTRQVDNGAVRQQQILGGHRVVRQIPVSYPLKHPFISFTILSTSPSLTQGPLGRHSPMPNSRSLTPFS